MATETSSDYAPATDELIVKKEKDEAIAQMIASLANEDGEIKHNKPDAQGEATASSNTEVETEGGDKNTEIGEDKSNNSPSLETPAEDNVNHEEVVEAQSASIPSSNTEGEAEPDGNVEKSGDPVTLEENVAGDSNEKKEQISEAAEPEEIPSIEPAVEETPQQLEKGSIESEEEKHAKTVDIPEESDETIEQSSGAAEEANAPAEEPETELVLKEAEVSDTSPAKEEKPELELEPEPVAIEVEVKTEEPEKESGEKPQEIEQRSSIAIPESSAEIKEELTDVVEENTGEVSVDALKEINKEETGSAETEKTELAISEIEKNPKEPENQPLEQKEVEKLNSDAIPEPSDETIDVFDDAAEGKTRELEPAVQTLKENNDNESGPTETEKEEPVVYNEQASKQEEEEQPEKAEPEPETVVPEIVAERVEKPGDIVEVHHPIESDTEVVKEGGNSESEVVPEKAKESELEPEMEPEPELEPVSTEVDGKPREQLEVSEEVEEITKDNVETKKEIVNETTAKIEETSDDTIKEPVALKEEETSIAENTPQVSSNPVEASQEAENVVEEDESKKESSFTNVIEEAPKEVAEVVKIPEKGSTDEQAKTCIVEEREYSVSTIVEEKTVVAENDDKKEPEAAAPDAISRDAEVEINKVEEQKETATGTKVDEISAAVKDPVRETLASKFEQQQEEESAAKQKAGDSEQQGEEPAKSEGQDSKESDTTKTSSDIPKEASAKPAQKQSNNIISKVKQSLVKAKKAIIGKSPSSKNHSSDAKDDIKVN